MSQSGSPGLHPTHDTTAGGVCPYLGRCDDAENYFSFPTVSNCCHTRKRPFSIEPSYQANVCLEGNWTSCPRYEEAKRGGVARRLPGWALVAIALAAVVLLGSLFLFVPPLLDGGTPTPTLVAGPGSSTPSPSTEPVSPTSSNNSTAQSPTVTETKPVPASTLPSPTPSMTPTTATPTATSTSTPTGTSTPTATSAPIATTVVPTEGAPTDTPTPRTPTSTPTEETSTDTPTPTPTSQRPARTATPTPTPYAVPRLLSPADKSLFNQHDEVILEWLPVGRLAENEYYAITVAYTHEGELWHDNTPWRKETYWNLSDHKYLFYLSDNGLFQWQVQVIQQTGIDEDGNPIVVARSPESETWELTWKVSTPIKTPPPPTPPPPTPLPVSNQQVPMVPATWPAMEMAVTIVLGKATP